MAQWVVNRGDGQFPVDGLADLKKLAQKGELDPGDLIQPAGAADWLYAIEVPELKGLLKLPKAADDDDDVPVRGGGGAAVRMGLFGVFGLMLVIGLGASAYFASQLPSGSERLLGEGGSLSYTEVLTIVATQLRAEPDANSAVVEQVPSDTQLDLLGKRGAFYKVKTKGGKEGWVSVADILAAYQLADKKQFEKMNPFYNPDQYAKVASAGWLMMVDPEKPDENKSSTFSIALDNTSRYPMTDVRLEAVLKDSKGAEVGKKEIVVEGTIPAEGSTMIGTLTPPEEELKAAEKAKIEPPPSRIMTNYTLDQEAKDLTEEEQEKLYGRWLDGVEVEVQDEFVEATVRIVEVRAVPNESEKAP
jgi:hypothetical protein